tara:strand:- start:367 stop:885 length:519 start_codon:yes stop_codon:yes gene_type:complete
MEKTIVTKSDAQQQILYSNSIGVYKKNVSASIRENRRSGIKSFAQREKEVLSLVKNVATDKQKLLMKLSEKFDLIYCWSDIHILSVSYFETEALQHTDLLLDEMIELYSCLYRSMKNYPTYKQTDKKNIEHLIDFRNKYLAYHAAVKALAEQLDALIDLVLSHLERYSVTNH